MESEFIHSSQVPLPKSCDLFSGLLSHRLARPLSPRHEILHGDFLEDKFRSRILDANLIFVNNFAFGTAVNQKLKEIFQYCHEGCRIVSSLNFAPMGFTITERTMGDIGCILSVRRATCTGEGVSWTARPFDYYVHTIDHTMVSDTPSHHVLFASTLLYALSFALASTLAPRSAQPSRTRSLTHERSPTDARVLLKS
jgi:hypothetical protein